MSGYASKREAMEVLKHTITSGWNSKAPSTEVGDYFLEKIFRRTFYHRGQGYGWGSASLEPGVEYEHVLAECLRPKARESLIAENVAAQGRAYDMMNGAAPLPEGLTKRDARDMYNAARERVALLRGVTR